MNSYHARYLRGAGLLILILSVMVMATECHSTVEDPQASVEAYLKIKGKVIYDGYQVPGATVILMEWSPYRGYWEYFAVDSTTSDTNGNYFISYPIPKCYSYSSYMVAVKRSDSLSRGPMEGVGPDGSSYNKCTDDTQIVNVRNRF